jgi:RNA polymerase sigma-70 factor, ECF subfamily
MEGTPMPLPCSPTEALSTANFSGGFSVNTASNFTALGNTTDITKQANDFGSWPWQPVAALVALPVGVDLASTLQSARLGDEWAFACLVNTYRGAAERLAQQILRTEEAAADAVQDALIKAYRALPRFQDGNFRSWLLRIVVNTCYDHLRRQKRRPASSLEELTEYPGLDLPALRLPERENPESLALQNEQMQTLLQAIDELPAWHRHVVLTVDVHGYDYGEAATLLNLPLGTVKSRLSRARAALRDLLVQKGVVKELRVRN